MLTTATNFELTARQKMMVENYKNFESSEIREIQLRHLSEYFQFKKEGDLELAQKVKDLIDDLGVVMDLRKGTIA